MERGTEKKHVCETWVTNDTYFSRVCIPTTSVVTFTQHHTSFYSIYIYIYDVRSYVCVCIRYVCTYIIHNVCQRARGVCVHNMFRHKDTSMHIQYAYVV